MIAAEILKGHSVKHHITLFDGKIDSGIGTHTLNNGVFRSLAAKSDTLVNRDSAGERERSLAEIQRAARGKLAEGFSEIVASIGLAVRGNNLIICYGGKIGDAGIGSFSLHIGSDESDCTALAAAGIFDAALNRGLYHRHRARVAVDHAAGHGGFLHADGAFSDVLHIAADGTAVDAEAGFGRLIDDAAGDAGVMQLQRRVAAVGGRCRLRQVGDFYNIALNFRAVYRDGNRSVVVAVVRDCVSVFILDFLRSDAGHVFV